MNRVQKYILFITLAVVGTLVGLWAFTGFHIWTKSQVPVEVIDELFGTKAIVWQDAFIVGLDITIGVSLTALVIGGLALYFFRTKEDHDQIQERRTLL